MSSSSSNNVEKDAWLMKIELKREVPVEAVKGDESKEATVDQPLVSSKHRQPRRKKKVSLNLLCSSYSY